MTVTAKYAAEHFEELASAIDRGEAVEIERPGKARLHLVAANIEETREPSPAKRVLGAGVGKLRYVPTHEQWQGMDRDLWGELLDGKIDDPFKP